ncbi:MAG TPA: hypothetical protein VF166_12570 [Gemmatimonadaceae bacterium]
MRDSRYALALIAAITVLVAGCQEKLSGGAACPSLCPEQNLTYQDTVIEGAIDTDVTVTGFPALGSSPSLLLANVVSGADTLHTVGVVRFDSLRTTFTPSSGGAEVSADSVDTAAVTVNLAPFAAGQDTIFVHTDSVTIRVYDVDTTADIFDTRAIAATVRPDRLIPGASRTVARDSITGALRIPLPSDLVKSKVAAGGPLLLGFEAVTGDNSPVQVRLVSSEGGNTPSLSYEAHHGTDSALVSVGANVQAGTGVDLSTLADYTVVVKGTAPPDSTMLAVGGIPGSRTYLRFNLPSSIVDSTTVVRASLQLTQRASPSFLGPDTATIVPLVVRATKDVTDPAKAALLAAPQGFINVPQLTVLPQDSGQRNIEIVQLVRLWRSELIGDNQRSLVLELGNEGFDPRQVLFYSSNAAVPDSLRPRLRLSYIPRASFGLP